nr:retrovirus-related Pol polyprotein from transposon TNT 1-94 [Tanacetum cinerariifolium]
MHLGLWYPKGTGIETVVYDSDHAGDYVDRKSTSDICTFVGCCLTSWFSKKQSALAISTIEAEYIRAGKACQQALWMKQALIDYDCDLLRSGISSLQQGELSSLAVGTSFGSRNSSLTVGMPCAFYFQQSSPKLDALSTMKFPE